MPCSGRDDEMWSASKKTIRFVELPVNSSRRRGKQRELNRIVVKNLVQNSVDKLTLSYPSTVSFGSRVH